MEFDIELLGSCDDVVVELCRRLDWKLEHEMIPEGLELKVELVEGEGRFLPNVSEHFAFSYLGNEGGSWRLGCNILPPSFSCPSFCYK